MRDPSAKGVEFGVARSKDTGRVLDGGGPSGAKSGGAGCCGPKLNPVYPLFRSWRTILDHGFCHDAHRDEGEQCRACWT